MIEHYEYFEPYAIELGDIIRHPSYGNCVIKDIQEMDGYTQFMCEDSFDLEHTFKVRDSDRVKLVFLVEEEVE